MECSIHAVSAPAPLTLTLLSGSCAEDAVLAACKRLGVAPIARPLFALRPRGSRLFLPDAAEVQPRGVYDLRIRFKVPKLRHLRSLDETTYDYYFRQARDDVVENSVPEIQYDLHKKELLGLGIADMYRAIQEDNVSLREVERRYKKYIPKEIIRKHQMFAKKPVHATLQLWCEKTPRQDPNYIKERYLQQLMMMAPNYLAEEYPVRWDEGRGEYKPARVQVIPYHQEQPGLRLFDELEKEWVHVCTMEQLCFLGRRASKELEVCRKNGVPVYLRFGSQDEIASFISACDGYYRLMVKWTFNLSKDDPTPSLERLYAMKCHGPVGGEFSYHKLSDKRSKKHGCFILRECQHDYDVYYIDACTKNSTTETYKVEYKYVETRVKEAPFACMCYVFNSEEGRPYASMEHLVRSFGDPDQRVYLKECLPPSEYDKSQLLLCGEDHKVGVRIDQALLQELLKQQRTPRCINTRDIQIYKSQLLLCGEQHKVGVRIDQAQLQELLKQQRTPRCINTRDIQIFKGKQGIVKPIYISELDDIGSMIKLKNSTFSYYSVTGTDVMWDFPFCDDEFVCEQHVTHLTDFVTRWPIRQINLVYELQLHVRSYHSAFICLILNPYHDYPRVVIAIDSLENTTRVEYQFDVNKRSLLSEVAHESFLDYFKWSEVHVTLFAQELHVLRSTVSGLETLTSARHEAMSSLRWFAVGSERSAARWALYCAPAAVDAAFPPECAATAAELGYAGTQAVTSAGAWCYTTDKSMTRDLCDVRDCALDETNIVLTKRGGALRYIYMLPEWKYTGPHGGLYFSLKEWNPDFLDGITFKSFSADKTKSYSLYIGAESNEKVILRFKDDTAGIDRVLLQNSLPHLIPAGKWGHFWIQFPKGQIKLGFQKREYPVFEWESSNEYEIFEPSFMSYQSLEGNVIGVHFQDKQCHTENTSTLQHTRIFSVRMWRSAEIKDYSNFSIYLRGNGIALIPLLVFPGSQVVGAEGVTATFKAIWKLEDNKKMEVALKTLVREKCDTHLKDFIELASKWAAVQSSSVVRMYGVTLISPSALVMEYLQYGPLDVYLSANRQRVEPAQLMTAAAGLARALWDLSEAGCVHGRLRCGKVLLARRDRDNFLVKLSDPGLHTYTEDDIHWIPVELYGDLSLARRSVAADVWAFGTTLWEIFSFGLAPTDTNPVIRQKGYEQGHRLACPSKCPRDVWTVILDCWLADPHRRAIPQVIMRDISHLLHREVISPNGHYVTIDSDVGACDGISAETVTTEIMFQTPCEPDNTSDTSRVTADSSLSFPSTSAITIPEHEASTESLYPYESYSVEPDVHTMQWVVGLGPNCRVTTQQRIGSGFYGEVYRGVLERDDQVQARQVAIKRLKGNGDGDVVRDFLTEIEVMKTLEHPNIVEIVGVCEENELLIVMEYVEHGALSSYLKFNKHRLTDRHLLKYAQDIASGMEYLSAKHLVHRDLAARNILVQDERHVKISDFGLARVTADNDKYRMKTWRDLPLGWYAPEATVGEFSHASDVWSYGVTLWEMFTYGADVPAFDLAQAANRAQCFTMPDNCPSEVYRRLMSPCWHYEPSDRPTFLALVHLCKQLLLQY